MSVLASSKTFHDSNLLSGWSERKTWIVGNENKPLYLKLVKAVKIYLKVGEFFDENK